MQILIGAVAGVAYTWAGFYLVRWLIDRRAFIGLRPWTMPATALVWPLAVPVLLVRQGWAAAFGGLPG